MFSSSVPRNSMKFLLFGIYDSGYAIPRSRSPWYSAPAKTQVTTVGSKSPDFSWLKQLTADFQLDLNGDRRSSFSENRCRILGVRFRVLRQETVKQENSWNFTINKGSFSHVLFNGLMKQGRHFRQPCFLPSISSMKDVRFPNELSSNRQNR